MKVQSHEIVQDVKKRMLEALHAREDIASRVHSYRIEGRTKGLVSTFRKVGITSIYARLSSEPQLAVDAWCERCATRGRAATSDAPT